MGQSWRDIARPIIYKVLQDNAGKDPKEVKKALHDAYPFGQRAMHPYKIWLDAIKVQTKKKRFGGRINVQPKEQGRLF